MKTLHPPQSPENARLERLQMTELINQLDPPLRRIVGFLMDGFSELEICTYLSLTRGSLQRCKGRLRRCFTDKGVA